MVHEVLGRSMTELFSPDVKITLAWNWTRMVNDQSLINRNYTGIDINIASDPRKLNYPFTLTIFDLVVHKYHRGNFFRNLTDDVELDDVTLLRVGRDLALVLAFVACLHVLNLQGPSVRRIYEKRLKPFVRDKHGSIYWEDMRVPSSDPRHLLRYRKEQINFNNIVDLSF